MDTQTDSRGATRARVCVCVCRTERRVEPFANRTTLDSVCPASFCSKTVGTYPYISDPIRQMDTQTDSRGATRVCVCVCVCRESGAGSVETDRTEENLRQLAYRMCRVSYCNKL